MKYKPRYIPTVRNFSRDDHVDYDGHIIYHVPTLEEYSNVKFINSNTIQMQYKTITYTVSKVDEISFLISNEDNKRYSYQQFKQVSFKVLIDSVRTILVEDDHYSIYKNKTIVIPIAEILANDKDFITDGLTPLILVGLSNPIGGTFKINGANIEFTNTSGEIGDFCSLTYTARNETGHTDSATIKIQIKPVPPIICNPETFDLQQGETLLLSKSKLSINDVDSFGLALTVVGVQNPRAGTVSLIGDNVSFKSTGISGFPAGFEYTVVNTDGTMGVGQVYINITPLPPIDGYVYGDASQIQNVISVGYKPPSVLDIFNTWARFTGSAYYANKSVAKGEGTHWQFLTNPDRVLMPTNTATLNGFVSPNSFDNYTFEATLSSDNADDDSIGLIVAFNRVGTNNEILLVNRTQGGMSPAKGWGFVYSLNGGYNWVVNNVSVGGVHQNSVSGDRLGWNNRKSRIKILRQGDIVKAWCTAWNDVTNYQVTSEITLDLSSDARLHQFRGKKPYGYTTHSQANSTYLDVVFKGGLDASKLYDAFNNTTWEYIGGQWIDTKIPLQQSLGYVREVMNPDTGVTYIIKSNEIIIKESGS